MYSRYKDRAEFVFVYVDIPHVDPVELRDRAGGPSATREAVIREGLREYRIDFPCLMDGPDDAVLHAYSADPARLVIVDRDGRIGFDSGSAMRSGLNPTGAEAWLEQHTTPLP
jgi:hypothetical protein